MQTITVNKDQLIAHLQQNRTQHREIFEQAIEAYREQAITELAARIEEIKANKQAVVRVVQFIVPEDHTDDYDRLIGMLTMDQGDTVQLTMAEYAQYVDDDWGWKSAFVGQALSNNPNINLPGSYAKFTN